MKPIVHILIDMDGVLADFLGATLALWNYPIENYPANEWEIAEVLGISVSDLWGTIDKQPDFWRNIKPYPWTQELLALLEASGLPWTVLTSPSRNPQCAAQKVEWMRKHIDDKFVAYMIGSRKHLLAKPEHMLIDDNDENVGRFRQNGGTAILFPARWNSQHYVANGFEHVKAQIGIALSDDPQTVRPPFSEK